MLIGKFKSNHPFLYVVLVFLALVLWIDGFIHYKQTSLQYDNAAPLYGWIANFFDKLPFLSVLLSFLFMLLQTFMFNKVICDKNLVDRNSHLPALLFMVLMSSSFSMFGLQPIWFANFFLILALDKIFDVFSEDDVFIEIFNVGFLVSLASLFYLPALWFIILVFSALIIYFLLNIRGIIASIIGFVTPYFFVALYFYWFDMLVEKSSGLWEFHQPLGIFSLDYTPYAKVSLGVFGFISLVAIAKTYLGTILDKPVRIRKRFQILLVFFLISLVSTLFASDYLQVHHAMIMLPLAAIYATFFQQSKKVFWNEFFFSLLIVLILLGKLVRLD